MTCTTLAIAIIGAAGAIFTFCGIYVARRQAEWMDGFYTDQNKESEQ